MDSSSIENNQNNSNKIQKKEEGHKKEVGYEIEVITSKICGKKYQHGSSTGILIDHLS
ncbi:6896_t:CDS:2, partial [Funneliformis caledonium]